MNARKTAKHTRLPISLSQLNKISGKILQGASLVNLRILVDASASAEFLDYARRQLFPLSDSVVCEVLVFSSERPRLNGKGDLNLLLAGTSEYNSLLIVQADEFEIPLVSLCEDISHLLVGLNARKELDPGMSDVHSLTENIIALSGAGQPKLELFEELFSELAIWVARNLGDARQALGRAYPFMRQAIATEIINNTAFINALVAAAFFIPGSDMPVLTANQVKMLLQVASVYGLELGAARLKELAVLLAGAVGSRTLARQLVARISLAAWVVRGTLGYSTTLAIGHAALAYYQQKSLEG